MATANVNSYGSEKAMLEQFLSGDTPWIVSYRSSDETPPVFCVCAGGGDVLDYDDFANALPNDQPVYVFGLPSFSELVQFPTVEQLAAVYVQKVRELQPQGPYQLCGHSFGGLVVYEMAARLAAAGAEVGLLALIDTEHPRFGKDLSRKEKITFQSTYLFQRVVKYSRNLVNFRIDQILADVAQLGRHRAKKIFWKIAQQLFSKEGRQLPNGIRSDALVLAAAWKMYVPKNYLGRIVLLNASERPPEYKIDATLGWKRCARGPIAVRAVPGDHYTIMHPPCVEELVRELSQFLLLRRGVG